MQKVLPVQVVIQPDPGKNQAQKGRPGYPPASMRESHGLVLSETRGCCRGPGEQERLGLLH